jgi:multidrug efflux pump subunit AcrA (membrane-fusion protein)
VQNFSVPKHLTRSALLAVLAAGAAGTPAQEVYKSVDAQGHVSYSDRGASSSAQKTSLRVEQPDPAEVARLAKEQALLKAEDTSRQKQQSTQESRCQSARNRYFTARDSSRLFRWDASGNKVYYSATEADALRADARRAMVAACSGG